MVDVIFGLDGGELPEHHRYQHHAAGTGPVNPAAAPRAR
jgi:hypothetical protein